MIQRQKLDSAEVTLPNNYAELSIELNYDNDNNSSAVSTNQWDWGNGDSQDPTDGYTKIKKHLDDGLCFVGIPHEIIIDSQNGRQYSLFNGYVDTSKSVLSNGQISAPSVELGGVDWLNDVSDGLSFEKLYSLGKITNDDFIKVPYCINKKQNGFEVIITVVTVFVVVDKLRDQIAVIQEMAVSATNPFESTVMIRFIIRILYITIMLTSLIGMIISLYNLVIQPVKYHSCMYVVAQLEKGLEHLGLKLSSSILQKAPFNQMAIMPEKYSQVENTGIMAGVAGLLDFNKSNETGFYNGTFGSLLRDMQQMFNAKIIIDKENKILYFEKYDFAISKPKYKLPDVFDSRYEYEYNTDECYSTIIVSFTIDSQDRNTVQNYKGTSIQITTSIAGTVNPQLRLLKGLYEARIPFARGVRKTSLNVMEKILDGFYKTIGTVIDTLVATINAIIEVINQLIRLLNKFIKALLGVGIRINFEIRTISRINIPSFRNLIENRIGMLMMESDFVDIPKLIMIPNRSPKDNTLLSNNETLINAKYLWDNYHYFRSFIGRNGWPGNQFLKRNISEIPFSFDDYENVRINNSIEDYSGKDCPLVSLKFNCDKQTTTGMYREQKVYATNLIETIYEPS